MADRAVEAATAAIAAQHDEEVRRYLRGEQPANVWRPEAYAQAAYDAILGALRRELPEHAIDAAVKEITEKARPMARQEAVEIVVTAFLAAALTGEGRDEG